MKEGKDVVVANFKETATLAGLALPGFCNIQEPSKDKPLEGQKAHEQELGSESGVAESPLLSGIP